MNCQMTPNAVRATEAFIDLIAAPRALATLAGVSKGTYRAAARRALKQLRQSHFSGGNRYIHSCWIASDGQE